MNELDILHARIDESDIDHHNTIINTWFQDINDEISKREDDVLLRKSEIERWTFSFNKNPDEGITSMMRGTKKMENGEEIPYEWPNKNDLTKEDYEHLLDRFFNCKNLYAKVEYGLLLFYSRKLKTNNDVLLLLNNSFDLIQIYHKKSQLNQENIAYALYLTLLIGNCLHIADSRKTDPNIANIFYEFIAFTSKVHNSWHTNNYESLRPIIDLTKYAIEYRKEFEKKIALIDYLHMNYKAALELSKKNNLGCIYVCNLSQELANYLDNTLYDWQILKAQQFEILSNDALKTGNLAAVSYIENALSIYKRININEKVKELEHKYDELRRIFRMTEVKQELPEEFTQRINDIITHEIETKSGQELIRDVLMFSPMYMPIDQIYESIKQQPYELFTDFLPSSIIDKFGNTVESFTSEDEKRQFKFWQTYEHFFQIGSQTLEKFFVTAIHAQKIDFIQLNEYLINTWIGQSYEVVYKGLENKLCPYDVIKPALKLYFEEIENWRINNDYSPNFICSTDSLVTKTEYLIRFFCKLANISTFTEKQKGSHKYKMEKNIDELLSSLKHTDINPSGFSEEHRIFIQFILSQKIGLNLRHRVAHGLMDADEYNFLNPLFIIQIILKLSGYSFKNV